MKLYYRENDLLKCEDMDYYMGKDKVAIMIEDDGIYVCVYEHTYFYHTYLVTEIEDMRYPDFGLMLLNLLREHDFNLNEDVIDMVINRVEKTFPIYVESYNHINKLLTQPYVKSARNL